jgi:hypothetical protein
VRPDVTLVPPLMRSRSMRTRDLVSAPVDSPLSIADGLVSDKHWKVPGLPAHSIFCIWLPINVQTNRLQLRLRLHSNGATNPITPPVKFDYL